MFDSHQNVIIRRLTDNNIIDLNQKSSDDSKYELEAKFTLFDGKKSVSRVTHLHYLRLIEILDNDIDYDKKIEKSDVKYYKDKIREIIINEKSTYEQKIQMGNNIDIYEYNIRISLNKEKSINPKNYKLISEGFTRGRTRNSYISKSQQITIDITEVTEKIDKDIKIKYEVEIEYYGLKSKIQVFFDEIEKIFKLMKATENIYPNSVKDKLDSDISLLLKLKPETTLRYTEKEKGRISPTTLVKARNIKYRDLVYEGIVGNNSVRNDNVLVDKREKGTDYYITYKADGIRKYLIIHDTGIWLVYPREEYNLVIPSSNKKYSNFINNYKDSVFDTELVIPKINENNIKYFVLAFDCLSFQGKTVENKSYIDRLESCEIISNQLNNIKGIILDVNVKESYKLPENPKLFFPLIKDLYNNRTTLNYNDDGFIFTPNNVIYNPRSQTIKFKVSNGYLYVLNKGREDKFEVLNYPKDSNVEFLADINNKIIEYSWDGKKLSPIKEAKKEQADDETSVFKNWDNASPSRPTIINFKVENEYLYVLGRNKKYVKFMGKSNNKLNYPRDSNVEFSYNFNSGVVEYSWNGRKLTPIKKSDSKADDKVKALKIWNDITSPDVAYNKSLINTPDVCKWKHPKDLTIDFLIQIKANEDASRRLELYVFDGSAPVIFTGTERYPLLPENIRMKGPKLTIDEINHSNKIIEFEWVKENDKIILQPRKYRSDKTNPNQKIVAEDVWEDIMDPIFIEDLVGDTPELAIKYHNDIKKKLYKDLSEKYNGNFDLLDIGSGRGGDIGKWKGFNGNIIAVEPYKPNRDQFIERLEKSGIENRVTIVPLGGEQTVEITEAVKNKVDVVTLMLSMSFFWSSDKHLDALVRTIVTNLKPGGEIIFLTIDGDSLEEVFKNNDEKIIAGARIHLYPEIGPQWGRPVDFELPGSIIEEGGQREYAVHIEVLTRKLSKFGFVLTKLSKAIQPNLLLSEQQLLYTRMYSYGSYVNIDDSKLEEFDSDIKLPIVPDVSKILKIPIKELFITNSGLYDDTYAPVKSEFKGKIVRIATIGGENTFMHAILKCFHEKYQNDGDYNFRINLVNNVRRELITILSDLEYTDYTYWQTVNDEMYPRLMMKQIANQDYTLDYSLQGLTELLNSKKYLDIGIFDFIAEIFNINVYIVKITENDIEYVTNAICKLGRPNLVISGNKNHFEIVAIDVNGSFQTNFDDNDEFIKYLELRSPKNKTYNESFDPDETFINDFINIFTTYGIFTFPDEIYDMDPNDPFRKLLDPLYDNIIELTSNKK